MSNKHSLAGNIGVVVNAVAVICVYIAFFSTNWIESNKKITGGQSEHFGLWTHCFRATNIDDVGHVNGFVNCNWIFDPYTPFIIITQVLYSITFVGTSITAVVTVWFYLCCTLEGRQCTQVTYLLGIKLIIFDISMYWVFSQCFRSILMKHTSLRMDPKIKTIISLSATLSVFTYAMFANKPGWKPGHDNNYFGWTFGIAIASCFTLLGSGACFLLETNIQLAKEKQLMETSNKLDSETEM